MMGKKRILHYLNQFFGQIGGEDKAHIEPMLKEGPVGAGVAINNGLGDSAEIVATIICGDSYFNENLEDAKAKIQEYIDQIKPDLVIAGPAFNAGRYGMACGHVAEVAAKNGIPVISGMYKENPGVEIFAKYAYILPTADSAAGMRKAVPAIVEFTKKYIETDGNVGGPEEAGYFPRGIRKNFFAEERGSLRAVKMLIKKLKGEDFVTEYPMPDFDRVAPNPPVADISKAKIALVTSGGIVPKGNPDRIESSSASKYGKYKLTDIDDFTPENSQTAHGGYDPVYANEDADRVLPLDVVKEMVKEGKIGSLHDYWYATVGNGTSVANAKRYAQEIAKDLVADGVQAVILTST
ncbi:beta-aspartate methyltransferase [Anoxybacter fermentans]|uniref:Beta-aspartate methyltransferase n=1 Tax=Anoxybacter fermentans TaxID=1323375 RepID=A0A3S9SX01_9FIRM|nr:beta-aspartate methyltransferase [Anoxybacter fermentans]